MNTHGKLSFAAVAATLLLLAVSCVTEEVYTPQAAENGTVPVSFTSVRVGTRAGTTTLDTLKADGGFRVFAWETGEEEWDNAQHPEAPDFMPLADSKGVQVTWSANKWTYTPTKYWPGKIGDAGYGKLTFFAYAPAAGGKTGVTGVTTTADATPKLAFTTPAKAASQVDLTADALYNQDYTTNDGNVPFTLEHLLSKISFEAQLSAEYTGVTAVTIDTLTLTYTPDKIESAGVYTFPDANDADGAWVLGSSTYMTGSDTIVTTAVALSTTHTEATSLNQSGDNYLMLLPQATEEGDLRVGIKYSVAEQGKEAQKYECTTLLPALVWEQGKQHTYTFRLMRNEVFIVTKVSAWDEGKGAGAPIYKELGVFSNAAGSGESSAIDWLAYNSANAGDNAVLFIQLPKETKTETVSFDAETDVGLAGVILTHTGSNPNDWTSAGNVTIDGGGRTIDLQGLPAGSPLVTVGEGVTLTLQHIAFKGLDSSDDDDAADNNSCLFLVDGGTLILGEGASITKNVSSGSSGDCIADAAGGVVVKAGTLAMLEGSAISNNTGQMGGGVAMRGTTGGAFTMEGGSIANNTATYAGGVYVEKYNNHTFTREGGTVSGNTNGKDWSDVGQVENAGTFSVYHLNLTSKIPVPVPGAQPPTFFSDCQYTGTVAWEMSDGQTHTGAFKASGGYKAKVTLAAASGYTFSGLAANSFTHNYTTDVTHAQGGEGDLTVTIPFYLDVSQGVSGANWTYSNSTFTITHSGDYVVTGTTTTNRVAVAQGVTANITTNNVSIDVSDVSNAVAFDIAAGARVELVLAGINTLKSNVSAGLHVPQGAELTITAVTSADSLLAVGGHSTIGGGAGIGGNSGENAGTITIHSGRIGAKGGDSGGNTNDHTGSAGIGGGAGSSMTAGYHSGNILIDGGTVNATGGHRGAGIGGGHFTIGGSITIGGSATVTATGGTGGSPGIGGGCQSRDGNIRITGSANVTAKGTDDGGPGIGNGGWRNYFTAGSGDNGDILIDGNSEVTATGGVYSAGIGGGTGDGGGNITIGGSATVTAYGGTSTDYNGPGGAAIGGGRGADGGTIQITGSAKVTAIAHVNPKNYGSGAAGIGGGGGGGNGGNITINGSATVNAESRNENGGAGIGGGSSTTIGQEKGGHGGTIAIGGSAKVTAYGQDGAGIGGGGNGNSGKITITGGVVTAYGYCGAGIGGGKNGNGEDISISGGIVYAYGTYYGSIYPAAIGGGGIEATGSGSGSQHAGKITISDGTVIATVSDANMTAIGGKSGQSTDAISINGGTVIATGAGIGKSESESAITTYLTENKPVIFATAINGYTSADGDAIVVGTDEVQFQSVTFGGEGPASSGTLLLQEGFTIPADGTLTIPPGWTLNLNGKTITNKGTIINGGTINDNGGTISNDGGTIE